MIGVNKLWKQKSSIGRRNNQNFVSVPHFQFRQMIEYKALRAGIDVIEQEESYTSKADITASDYMPVYGKEKCRPVLNADYIHAKKDTASTQIAMERQTSSERQSRMHGKTYQTFTFLQHRKVLDLRC